MRKDNHWRPRTAVFCLLLAALGVAGINNVTVTIPEAIAAGETASLQCQYDLGSDALYSVKWYKGRQEFFRYIPKELPHTRVFPLQGAEVDIGRSGPATVVLRGVTLSLSGRYRCEVSADAPSFHTLMKTSYMHVVELPKTAPVITAEKTRIAIGDTLRVRCIAPPAHPQANLTWFLNNTPVKGTVIDPDTLPLPTHHFNNHRTIQMIPTGSKHEENNTKMFGHFYEPENPVDQNKIIHKRSPQINDPFYKRPEPGDENGADSYENEAGVYEGKSGIEQAVPTEEKIVKKKSGSSLELVIGPESFLQGRLSLTCRATVFSLYDSQVHLILDGEKPQIASVLGTRESSSGSRGISQGACVTYVILYFLRVWTSR